MGWDEQSCHSLVGIARGEVMGMCEYCNNDYPVYVDIQRDFELEIYEGSIRVYTSDDKFTIDIDYCPKCGERLSE